VNRVRGHWSPEVGWWRLTALLRSDHAPLGRWLADAERCRMEMDRKSTRKRKHTAARSVLRLPNLEAAKDPFSTASTARMLSADIAGPLMNLWSGTARSRQPPGSLLHFQHNPSAPLIIYTVRLGHSFRRASINHPLRQSQPFQDHQDFCEPLLRQQGVFGQHISVG